MQYILGILTGIAFCFLYEVVSDHQRRKRRQAHSQQVLRKRL